MSYAGTVDVLLMFCVLLQSIWHFPEAVEKFVKEVKKISRWFVVLLVFLVLGFFS